MSVVETRLKVVVAWHMHQPQYRDLISGQYELPWTYLHAMKDYTDMAAHLEAVPAARAVVNFAPLLLEQLADYSRQIDEYQRDGRALRDPLLAALVMPVMPADAIERTELIKWCLRAHEVRMIGRSPTYKRLADMASPVIAQPQSASYFHEQYLIDLVMWYHLAWLGETVRRSDLRARRLLEKDSNYTLRDRQELLGLIGELIAGVVPRYRQLAQRGQVELSVTPYAHPITPLLLDFNSARDAIPDAPLPAWVGYPGGDERARWHIREGITAFEKHFGFRPVGCWPAEGGVSTRAVQLFGEAGFKWTATGERVLRNSVDRVHTQIGPEAMQAGPLYTAFTLPESPSVRMYFRDDGLSDLIGFTYATWHADDAVADLIKHLEQIADGCAGVANPVATICLDGENAWEHFPENGYYFLTALYRRLAEHPRLEMTTFGDCADAAVQPLPVLVAGSWVYGTFSTWMGDVDKNRGWDMLVDAKRAFDSAVSQLDAKKREAAERQLAICEGSDWFWWFGDYNPESTVSDFDRLFRLHLTNLYRLLGLDPPEYLTHVFAHGSGAPVHGGAMRPGSAN
jgi:alpha-amylase/alpha-mannosidase (GH57 family)